MATFLGNNAVDTFKLGGDQVDKIYQGSDLVFDNSAGAAGYLYYRHVVTLMGTGTSIGHRIYQYDFFVGGTGGTQVVVKLDPSMVSSSTDYTVTYDSAKAADNDTASSWLPITPPTVGVPQWWQANMVSAVLVDTYQFLTSDVTRCPVDWTFEGSNDEVNWTILHTVVGDTPTNGTRTFTIP